MYRHTHHGMRTSYVLCILALASLEHIAAQTVAPEAGCTIDICIAIDRSETIDTTEWQQMLNFVSYFSASMDLDTTTTRVGLVSFDQIATLDIQLNDHTVLHDLQADIVGQLYGGLGRDISLGLYRMRTDCFTEPKGDRTEVRNFAVVITDGESDHENAVREGDLLRQDGTTIVTIGVGPNANQPLLWKISGGDDDLVFHQVDFAQLEQNRNLIMGAVCPGFGGFPKLEGPISITLPPFQGSEFSWECSFNYSSTQDDSARYQVTFYHNDVTPIGSPVTLEPPEKSTFLPGTELAGRLGFNVSCEVVTYWNESSGDRGPPTRPAVPYYAGLLISTKSVDISEVDHVRTGGAPSIAQVYITSTVPLLCPDEESQECMLMLVTRANSSFITGQSQASNNSKICSTQLTLADWSPSGVPVSGAQPLLIKATSTLVKASNDITGDVTLSVANEQGAIYDMWRNHPSLKVQVSIRTPHDNDSRPYCHSQGDPHLQTFDSKNFDIHDPGIYDLFHNRDNNTRIQTMHEACSPDRPSCMKNCGIAMYMVDVSTRPTTSFTYIVTRCNTDDNEVKVLQCQSAQPDSLQYPVTSSADMSAYYIRSFDGVVVTIQQQMAQGYPYVNVYVDGPRSLFNQTGHICGTCGDYNGDPSNDFAPCGEPPELPLEEFLLSNRIELNGTNLFECPDNTYGLNATDTADIKYCICESENAQKCLTTNIIYKEDETYYYEPALPSFVLERTETNIRAGIQTTDNIDYEYTAPIPDTSPITNPQPPPWGTYGITEADAEAHCITTLTSDPSYQTCATMLTDQDKTNMISACKLDIQIIGDLSIANLHLVNLAQKCEYRIMGNITVSDPQDPMADPEFRDKFGAFLNTTCPNDCSTHGSCNLGVCMCQSGWIGPDCSVDQDTPPIPKQYKDPAVCDVFTRPCQSVNVEADDLVNSDLLSCRVTIDKDDGTTSVNTSRGSMLTTTTVMCDIPDLLTLGDMAYPIIYNYTIALSNNRENFATVVTNETRLVWQSDWYWPECVQEALFLSKLESCVIGGACITNGTINPDVACEICSPINSTTEWTPNVEEDTNLSPWSNYTDCSKNCDYGLHSRSRFCEVPDLTCCGYGPHKEEALCNMGNCDELPDEDGYGVIVHVSAIPMLEWILMEEEVDQVVTSLLNDYTSQHPEDFCISLGLQPIIDVPTPGDILHTVHTRVACGYPKDDPSNNITTKLITEVAVTDVDSVCIITGETGTRVVSSDFMIAALADLEVVLEQIWGDDLDVVMLPPPDSTGHASTGHVANADIGASLRNKPRYRKHQRVPRRAEQCTR